MCGLFGIATAAGRRIDLSDRQIESLRDRLTHRGPDRAGLWRGRSAALAHRRLIVIDPAPAADQPMRSPALRATGDAEGRFILVYNGELYNDRELRRELSSLGVPFRTTSDTETVLLALMVWGRAALARFRGMFALALHDTRQNTLLLARDPLGIKPLYSHASDSQIIFASEPSAILAHPDVTPAPNLRMISGYLTTIRTVLGRDTLYAGIHALAPGEAAFIDLDAPAIRPALSTFARFAPTNPCETLDANGLTARVREGVEDSIRAHLRADVPTCALLSGGLDSTIIAAVARRAMPTLRTYAAGCPLPAHCADDPAAGDLAFARRAADDLGTDHAEAHVTRELFAQRWPWMVEQLGTPLSTPNEVAIHAVAERLRADGCVVTLSGEGADELFAGYELPLASAARFIESGNPTVSPAQFELENACWIAPRLKQGIFQPEIWSALDGDEWLYDFAQREFDAALDETAGQHTLETHLRMQRRINLTGLLQRLDTSTMLAGVEGRTPFADADIARLAGAIPMAMKFTLGDDERAPGSASGAESRAGGTAIASRTRTKLILREAFEGQVPEYVLDRPKASFPLPFQQWVSDLTPVLAGSSFAREVFNPAAIRAVCERPSELWHLAWPMINIALWGKRWG